MYASPDSERLARVFAGPGRPVLEALAALDAQWRLAVRPGIDHGLAHATLAWWRTELGRLNERAPEHPLTRQLARAATGPVDFSLLGARLDAADLALGGFAPESLAQLEALAARSHGSLWQLAAQLLSPAAAAPVIAGAATLGRAFGLMAYQREAADTATEASGIGAAALLARALALLDASEVALPAHGAPALAALLIARALERARLARAPRATPTRFVQLWIAWRAARRAHRNAPP